LGSESNFRPLRARSLIVTVFGDALAPHGGETALGSLIAAAALFGVNERLVRTAVLRLQREDWLAAQRIGRRSDYRLSDTGWQRYEDAQRRIYAAGAPAWDGTWTLVLPGRSPALRCALALQGFGAVGEALVHPLADRAALEHALHEHEADRAVVLHGEGKGLAARVAEAWDLDALAHEYRDFVRRFGGEAKAPRRAAEECFRVRILAVHEYRRILLRDPELPEELLGRFWPGGEARAVLRTLYRRVERRAEEWIMREFATSSGPLPPAAASYYTRFGGLR
jgi:phenylacetic acid degradation operon negative regulatory protein